MRTVAGRTPHRLGNPAPRRHDAAGGPGSKVDRASDKPAAPKKARDDREDIAAAGAML